MSELINLQRGSDLDFTRIWYESEGVPLDLTDWTVAAFEPHPALVGNLTLTRGAASRI